MNVADVEQDRMRRGSWGLLAIGLTYPTLLTWVYFLALGGAEGGLQRGVYAAGKLLQFSWPLLWAWWGRVALIQPPTRRGLGLGVAFGVAVGCLIGLAYVVLIPGTPVAARLSQTIAAKLSGFAIDSAPRFIALSLFYSLIHSGLEEYYWRWFVYRAGRARWSVGIATLVSSLGFMSHHVLLLGVFFGWSHPLTWICSAGVAVGGAFWAWLYERSGQLLGSWLGHLLVDAAIFAVGYMLFLAAKS